MIIGLSGYARSGKDEAAKVLVEEFDFTRIAFADKLRLFLYALNPVVTWTGTPPNKNWYVQDVIDTYGWDRYKETDFGPEVRRLLQRLGTEAGRNTLSDTLWVDAAFEGTHPDGNYVITDVRFPNEAESVKERGGQMWRIDRDNVGPANAHASETSLDDYKFDRHVNNTGDLETYRDAIRQNYKDSLGLVYLKGKE